MMNYYYSMMGFGSGYGGITTLLLWVVLILSIIALWKYISKK